MNEYYIGIIDEDQDEIYDIKRTILVHKPEIISEDLIKFVDYPLSANIDTLSDEMSMKVLDDITDGRIHILIVDYRIIVETTCIEGTEIFEKISALVPKFPTIILTNVPEDCYDKPVDADKVYAKREFFKIEGSYSKEKTLNIFRNIENYKKQRATLMVGLEDQLSKFVNQGYTPEVYQGIIELEKKLADYFPQEQSTVEKDLDLAELRDAVELLKEANQLLGGKSED